VDKKAISFENPEEERKTHVHAEMRNWGYIRTQCHNIILVYY